jgi:hypothetical protein
MTNRLRSRAAYHGTVVAACCATSDLTTPDGEMVAALESQDEMCGKKQG